MNEQPRQDGYIGIVTPEEYEAKRRQLLGL